MKFDIITYPSDQWREGDTVVATVEADTALEAARQWAAKRGYDLDEKYGNDDPNQAVVGVWDEAMPASKITQDMTPYSMGNSWDLWSKCKTGYRVPGVRRKARWVPFPARVTVTAYPYLETPAYEGEVTHHANHKAAVSAAFRQLRKEGVVARQRYKCCMSCASSAIDSTNGAVFYHAQDASRAWYSSSRYDRGIKSNLVDDLHLRYQTETGEGCRELGIRLVQALQANGLVVEWDGDPSKTITVPADQNSAIAA